MAVMEAFEAKQNIYFDYDFEEMNQLAGNFPEELYVSLRGMLYRHEIQYPDAIYYIYFTDILTGDELEKMKADWSRYCPRSE